MDPIFNDIVRLLREGQPFSLATVAHTSGSTPQRAGARAVFLPDGRILGTLGGGCMEAEARRRGLNLLIAGAGHVGTAVCCYAARAGFEVTVVDDRPSLANAERLPGAARVLAADVVATTRDWPKTPDTYFVIVTRGHRNDAVVLREVI